MDEPEHTSYRASLDSFFAHDAISGFEAKCRELAVDATSSVLHRGSVDVVEEFTEPYALKSLCEFLGWPKDTWHYLRGWAHDNQQVAFTRDRTVGKSLAEEFAEVASREFTARRTAESGTFDDLTAQLVKVEVAGTLLTEEDLVSIVRNWAAGHGTVAAGLGLVIKYLAEHLNLQQQLRADSSAIPAAIEEILRVDGPLVANRRTATENVKLGGRDISAGELITIMWIGGNRDESVFSDAQDVRLNRDSSENLLFGWGLHNCQGIHLARLELRVAIEELLFRTSRFEPDNSNPVRRDVYPSNGLGSLSLRVS
ncbi:MAG: cytochrome P450 [Thermomicrobiales bacterium]